MCEISNTKSEYKKSNTSLGWKTKRGDVYIHCPFHVEKIPSCWISVNTPKYFKCFGCGQSGKVSRLQSKYGVLTISKNEPLQLEFEFVKNLEIREIPKQIIKRKHPQLQLNMDFYWSCGLDNGEIPF